MRYALVPILAILLAGCAAARSGPEVISHGMKWSIAQRELEQNSWLSTLAKNNVAAMRAANDGRAYRYLSPTGETVDIVTEQIGDIEKVYRIFDVNGKELDSLPYR